MTPPVARPAGRPDAAEAKRRTALFIELVADGMSGRKAARRAGVSIERGIDIACSAEFHQLVAALRAGQLEQPVVVYLEPPASARAAA